MRELAAQFLTLAEKQGAPVPLMVGHRIMGVSLMFTGNLVESRNHFDRAVDISTQAVALYDPVQHRAFASVSAKTREPQYWAFGRWPSGYLAIPRPRRQTADQALEIARNGVKSAR